MNRKTTGLAVALSSLLLASPAWPAITVGSALAGDPTDEICALAVSMGSGTDAIISQLQDMAKSWGESDRAKLGPIMGPEIGKFSMEPGVVYRIGNLAPFMQEYLVVTADRSEGQTIYFRVIYETGPNGYYFKNVKFNSDFYKIMEVSMMQPPEAVECK